MWREIMGHLPVLKPREVVALLEALGFVEVRQRGSHKQFRHPDGRCTTVPFHAGRDISPVLLRQIAKDIGLTVEELLHPKA
jgi:predicted RNA binding protein YcfA (HicA-like mRNA interferase family)